jgi:hypothetical protein
MAGTKLLSAFASLPEIAGMHVATKDGLRCTAIELVDGGVCLFSPVSGLVEEGLRSLHDLGQVTHLLAPNHYHHLGLTEYVKAFPKASLCASSFAAQRLAKVTGLVFSGLNDLANRLPKSMDLIEPRGLKTGEVWLRYRSKRLTAWLLVDALAGPKMSATSDRFACPDFVKTFPNFGVRDKAVYAAWFAEQVAADRPQMIVPCHGGIVAAEDLPAQLLSQHRSVFKLGP